MGSLALRALRVVLALGFAGSVFVQVVMVPLLAVDLDQAPQAVRVPVIVIVLLGIVSTQVVMVCVWRLLTLVRRGTVFSHASFRYVDVVIGAIAAASLLTFGLGCVLAPTSVAPGIVLLVGGAALMIAGIALLVLVLRTLLAQAVARDAEAQHLRAELNEVI